MDKLQYCMQILKQRDFDRYISLLFAPSHKRAGLAALFAFNSEIARIRNIIKEPLAGEIRLRWWADNISRSSSEATQNPILDSLLETIALYNLPKKPLIDACEARIFDLYNDTFSTITDFEGYCGETQSTFLKLACHIMDEFEAQNSNEACGHGGVSLVFMQMIRFLPTLTAAEKLYIPTEILNAIGVKREDLAVDNGHIEQKVRVISALTAFARDHYKKFKNSERQLKPSLRPIFLPIAIAPYYINEAQREKEKVFTKSIEFSKLRRQWYILKTAVTGNF